MQKQEHPFLRLKAFIFTCLLEKKKIGEMCVGGDWSRRYKYTDSLLTSRCAEGQIFVVI